MWTERRFLSFDKTPIFYRWLGGPEKPKAAVIILHGMGEHGGRYRHLAEYLASSPAPRATGVGVGAADGA